MKIEENKEEYNPQHLTTEKFHTDQSETETGTSRDDKDEELSNVPGEKVLNASAGLPNDSKVSDEQLNDAILKDNDTTIDKISGAPDKINENGTKTKRMKQSEVLVNQTMPDKTTDQAKDGGTKTKKMTESKDASGKGKRKRYKLKCKNCTCENCPLKEYQKKKKAGKLEEVVGPVCKCEPKCACMDCEYIKRLRELLCNTVCGGTPKPEIETPDRGRDTPEPGTNIPEPVKDTPDPVTGSPKSGRDTPEPETDTPEPVTDTPKPRTDTPELGTDTPETGTDTPETDTPKTPTRNCLPCCCPELIQKKRKCKCICAGKSGTFDGNPRDTVQRDSANDRLTREASKNQSLTQSSSENEKSRKKLLLADNVQDNVQSAKEHSKNFRHSETKSKDQPDSKYDIQYVSVILPSSDTALNCCKLCREENRFFDSKEEEVGCPKEQEVGCPKEQVESCPNDSKSTESGEGNTKDAEGSKTVCKKCSCKVCPLKEYEKRKQGEDNKDPLSVMKCDCSPECNCQNCAYIKCVRELLKKCDLILKLKQKSESSSSKTRKLVAKEFLKSTESVIEEKDETETKIEDLPVEQIQSDFEDENKSKVTGTKYVDWSKTNVEARSIEQVQSCSCFEDEIRPKLADAEGRYSEQEDKIDIDPQQKKTVTESEYPPEKSITGLEVETKPKITGTGYVCPPEKRIDPCGKTNDKSSSTTNKITAEDVICKCGKICPCENCKTLKRLRLLLNKKTEPQVYCVVNTQISEDTPPKCECMGKCKGSKLKEAYSKIWQIKSRKFNDTSVVQCVCKEACKCNKCQFNTQSQSKTEVTELKSSNCASKKTKSSRHVTIDIKSSCGAPQETKLSRKLRKKCKSCCRSFKRKKIPSSTTKEDITMTKCCMSQEEIKSSCTTPSEETKSYNEEIKLPYVTIDIKPSCNTPQETKLPSNPRKKCKSSCCSSCKNKKSQCCTTKKDTIPQEDITMTTCCMSQEELKSSCTIPEDQEETKLPCTTPSEETKPSNEEIKLPCVTIDIKPSCNTPQETKLPSKPRKKCKSSCCSSCKNKKSQCCTIKKDTIPQEDITMTTCCMVQEEMNLPCTIPSEETESLEEETKQTGCTSGEEIKLPCTIPEDQEKTKAPPEETKLPSTIPSVEIKSKKEKIKLPCTIPENPENNKAQPKETKLTYTIPENPEDNKTQPKEIILAFTISSEDTKPSKEEIKLPSTISSEEIKQPPKEEIKLPHTTPMDHEEAKAPSEETNQPCSTLSQETKSLKEEIKLSRIISEDEGEIKAPPEEIKLPSTKPFEETKSPKEEIKPEDQKETKVLSQEEIKLPKYTRQEERMTKEEFEATKQTSLCTQFFNKTAAKSSTVICSCLNENCDCKQIKRSLKKSQCKCTDSSKDLISSSKCSCLETCKCVQCKHKTKSSIKCDCVESCKCTNCRSNPSQRAQCNCVDPCKCLDCKFNPVLPELVVKVETLDTETDHSKSQKDRKKCKCIGTCTCPDKCTLEVCNPELTGLKLETPNQIPKPETENKSFPCNTQKCTCTTGQCLTDSCLTKNGSKEKPSQSDSSQTNLKKINKSEEKSKTECKCTTGECKADSCPTKNESKEKPSQNDSSQTNSKEIESKYIGVCKYDPCCKLFDKIVATEKKQCNCIGDCKCTCCILKPGKKCNITICKCKCGECLKDLCPTKTTEAGSDVKPPTESVQPESEEKPIKEEITPTEPEEPESEVKPIKEEITEPESEGESEEESEKKPIKEEITEPESEEESEGESEEEFEEKPIKEEITPTEPIKPESELKPIIEEITVPESEEKPIKEEIKPPTDPTGLREKTCSCCNCKSDTEVNLPKPETTTEPRPEDKIIVNDNRPVKTCKCKDFECLPTDFKLKYPLNDEKPPKPNMETKTESTLDTKEKKGCCCWMKKPEPEIKTTKDKVTPTEPTESTPETTNLGSEVKVPDKLKQCNIPECKCIYNECLKENCPTKVTKTTPEVKALGSEIKETDPSKTTEPEAEVKVPDELQQCNISECKCLYNECLKENCPTKTTKPTSEVKALGPEVKVQDELKQCNISECKCKCNECLKEHCPTKTTESTSEVKDNETTQENKKDSAKENEEDSTKENKKDSAKENEEDSTKEKGANSAKEENKSVRKEKKGDPAKKTEPVKREVKCKCTNFECLPDDFKCKNNTNDQKDLVKPESTNESSKKCICTSKKKPKLAKKKKVCKCKIFECLPEDFKRKFPTNNDKDSDKPKIKEPPVCGCTSKKKIDPGERGKTKEKKCKCKKYECLPEDVKEKIRQKYNVSIKKPNDNEYSKLCKCKDFECLPEVKSEKSIAECECSKGECDDGGCQSNKKSLPELELKEIEQKSNIPPAITLKPSEEPPEEIVSQKETKKQPEVIEKIGILKVSKVETSPEPEALTSDRHLNEDETEISQVETTTKSGPCSGPKCKCASCKDTESSDSKHDYRE